MARLVVQGVTYEVPETFTYGELATLQTIAGDPPEGGQYAPGNAKVTVALAFIVMERAGQKPELAKLFALTAGEIHDEEAEAPGSPLAEAPAETAETPTPTGPPETPSDTPDLDGTPV